MQMQHIDFLAIILRAGVGAWGRGGDTNTINKIQKMKECKYKISLQVAMLGAGVGGWGRGPDQIPNTSTEYNKEYKK